MKNNSTSSLVAGIMGSMLGIILIILSRSIFDGSPVVFSIGILLVLAGLGTQLHFIVRNRQS